MTSNDHASDLTELPGRVQAELTRLRAERQLFTAEQDRLKHRLAETEHELHRVRSTVAEPGSDGVITELEARVKELDRERRELAARAEALDADVLTARGERDTLRAELLTARAERDRLRLRLLDAELALAAGSEEDDGTVAVAPEDTQRAMLAEQRAGELARELAATRETLSWRVTKPLRAVRRKIPKP